MGFHYLYATIRNKNIGMSFFLYVWLYITSEVDFLNCHQTTIDPFNDILIFEIYILNNFIKFLLRNCQILIFPIKHWHGWFHIYLIGCSVLRWRTSAQAIWIYLWYLRSWMAWLLAVCETLSTSSEFCNTTQWNKLPNTLKVCCTISCFKTELKQHLKSCQHCTQ